MLLLASSVCGLFKWRQFEPEVILLAVGWYLRFSLSYLRFRGVDQWRIRAEQPVMHLPIAERPVFVLLLEHTLHCVE